MTTQETPMDTTTETSIERYVWAPDYITAAQRLTTGHSYFSRDGALEDNLNSRTEHDTLFRFVIATDDGSSVTR